MELTELTKHLNKINIPRTNDRIYKDECVYSFDTPVRLYLVFCSPLPTTSPTRLSDAIVIG